MCTRKLKIFVKKTPQKLLVDTVGMLGTTLIPVSMKIVALRATLLVLTVGVLDTSL